MKMMPLPKAQEFKPQALDKKKITKEEIGKKTFKEELDNKTSVTKKSKKTDEIQEKRPVEEGKSENKKNEVVKNSDGIKNEQGTKNIIEDISAKINKITEKSVKKGIKKDNKLAESKNKGEVEVKRSDKDTLNQSIAGSELVDTPVQELSNQSIKTEKESAVKEIELENGSKVGQKEVSPLVDNSLIKKPTLKKSNSLDSKTEEKKDEKKIKVTDFRSKGKAELARDIKRENLETVNQNQTPEVKSENIGASEEQSSKTILLGTTEISAEGEGGKSQAPIMKEAASVLKQQLKDFGNNEIVKQSRFILKDNNVGEIKLILKPESLGQVKINLNLKQNSLAGQIVVENNSVKDIFQENIPQLSKALEEQGFDSANLSLSLSDKGQEQGQKENRENKQYFSDRLKKIDNSGQVVRYGAPTAGINLTA